MSALANRLALVTGAASGIGRLVAARMAAAGARIVLWDVAEERLAGAADAMRADGGDVSWYSCDVTDRLMVYETARRVEAERGGVDVLVNNAGVVSGKPFWECPDGELTKTLEVNVMSMFWTVKAFLPRMMAANDGHVVTMSSAAGIHGSTCLSEYCASKFAAFGFDESLRLEFRKRGLGIRTTVVCPFFVDTGMFAGVKTRFPRLLPILPPDYVADRIVRAIERGERRVLIPRALNIVWLLRYLPVSIADRIVSFLGVTAAMDSFQGRGPR